MTLNDGDGTVSELRPTILIVWSTCVDSNDDVASGDGSVATSVDDVIADDGNVASTTILLWRRRRRRQCVVIGDSIVDDGVDNGELSVRVAVQSDNDAVSVTWVFV